MALNLNQITLLVTDVAVSVDFYQKLGLRLIVLALPKYARFESPAGDSTFSLHQADAGQNIHPSAWIYFETETLDEDVQALEAQGFVMETAPEDQPWLWREARLKDPDGHQIILFWAGENRKNPPWRLG